MVAGLIGGAEAAAAEVFLRSRRLRAVRAHHRAAASTIRPAPRPRSSPSAPAISPSLSQSGAALVEFGCGSSTKTRIVLHDAQVARRLCPGRHLGRVPGVSKADATAGDFPDGAMLPVAADFSKPFRSAHPPSHEQPRVGFFQARPSAISSRTRRARSCAMRAERARPRCGTASSASIWSRTHSVLQRGLQRQPACNRGVQSKSAPTRINRRARRQDRSSVDLRAPRAFSTASARASKCIWPATSASGSRCCGECIDFRAGETIHTENSYKAVLQILRRAGARRRLGPDAGMDGPQEVFQRPRADAARGAAGGVAPRRISLRWSYGQLFF